MKNSAKLTVLLLLMVVFSYPSAGSQRAATPVSGDQEVKVYYFHATARCVTCKAVEDVTQKALKELYGKKVAFESINREEDKDNPLIAKHKVAGQTLLVISGDKVVNLTNDAFLNARTKPEKLKEKIKATIDPLLEE